MTDSTASEGVTSWGIRKTSVSFKENCLSHVFPLTLSTVIQPTFCSGSGHSCLGVCAAAVRAGMASFSGRVLFLVEGKATRLELAGERVAEPNSVWKVVTREASHAGDSFVSRSPQERLHILCQLQMSFRPPCRQGHACV